MTTQHSNDDWIQTTHGRLWGPSEFTITGKLKDYDLIPRLHALTLPVLLTCGDFDEAGVKTLKDCQAAMANAHLAVLPNASHLHHLEKPDLFLSIVRGFLCESLAEPQREELRLC